MARALRYSSTALEDIAHCAAYIRRSSGSRKIASAFVAALLGQCERLARLPGQLGRPRPELRAGMRSSAFKNHVIFFHYAADTVEIVRIIEHHRDLGALFGNERD